MSAHAVKPAAHVWQPADDDRLAELWGQGMSSVQIARRMATSKGSILGRAHRLELPKRPSPIPNPEQRLKTATDRANALARAVARLNSTVKATRLPAQADQSLAASQHPTEPETPCAGNVAAPEAMSETTPWHANDNRNACQWPIGHPKAATFRFCAAPALATKPYCLTHCRVAFVNFRSHDNANNDRVYVPTWLQSR